jgi:hypothetical protein
VKTAPKKSIAEQLTASAVFQVAIDELEAARERDELERPYSRRGAVLDLSSSPPRVSVFRLA